MLNGKRKERKVVFGKGKKMMRYINNSDNILRHIRVKCECKSEIFKIVRDISVDGTTIFIKCEKCGKVYYVRIDLVT